MRESQNQSSSGRLAAISPASLTPARQTCGAKTRGGGPCKRFPCPGKRRCRLHGGKTPCGIASPHFKTGKHCKYLLGGDLLDRFLAAQSDPELLSLRSEAALLDARLQEIVAKFKTGETASHWSALQVAWAELTNAQRRLKAARTAGDESAAAKDQAAASAALEGVGRLIVAGNHELSVWADVVDAISDKQRVATAEHKRLQDLNQFMTAEQVMTMASAMLSLVKQNVTDRVALVAISEGFGRMFGVGGR
jgi:hypothetical protein